jgi:transglutaminase/protease-like cytokinesis protein 3
MNRFLNESDQTKNTPKIKGILQEIKGNNFDFIVNTLLWLQNNLEGKDASTTPNYKEVFRKRTATQIIEEGYTSRCTDQALVFIALCRAKGYPTKYVEAIHKSWLNTKDTTDIDIKDHVFAEVEIDKKYYVIDPAMGRIHVNPNDAYRSFAIYAKDYDSWGLDIKSHEDLEEKFNNFKNNYNN